MSASTDHSLYLFDLDGTLVHDYLRDKPGGGFEPDPDYPYLEPRILPGRLELIRLLAKEEGVAFGICTNQAGAALGYCTEKETSLRIARSLVLVDYFGGQGRPLSVQVCYDHPNATEEPYKSRANRTPICLQRRKPNPGMLKDAMAALKRKPKETVFVGDRDTDRLAAEAARVQFVWAEDFFHAP